MRKLDKIWDRLLLIIAFVILRLLIFKQSIIKYIVGTNNSQRPVRLFLLMTEFFDLYG